MPLRTFSLLLILLNFTSTHAQEKGNEFFTFFNMMDGDTISTSIEHKVSYIQSVGYKGLGFELNSDFAELYQNLSDYEFKSSVCVLKIDMDKGVTDNTLRDSFRLLKGSKCIISPTFYSNSKYLQTSEEGDDRVKALTIELAKLARKSKLDVAIFHYYGSYVQSHAHAARLAKEIGKLNIGYGFNLGHWLATTNLEERNLIKSELMESLPKLKVITINGANRVITKHENPWEDYILPLGKGTFDTFELVEYLIKRVNYKGPIGIECKGLKGDKMQLAEDTMLEWKSYLSAMELSY